MIVVIQCVAYTAASFCAVKSQFWCLSKNITFLELILKPHTK